VNEAEPELERDQKRELEALLELSRRSRAKLERLHEVLTTPGHYGIGATPATVVYRENKLRLLRLLDETGKPRAAKPPVLACRRPSCYFILDLPGRSFAGATSPPRGSTSTLRISERRAARIGLRISLTTSKGSCAGPCGPSAR
jgi:hypothetical protein